MKQLVALALSCAVMTSAFGAEIVIPSEGKPTTINEGETIRIEGKGIAGSEITITVDGENKGKVRETTIIRRSGRINFCRLNHQGSRVQANRQRQNHGQGDSEITDES